MIRVRPISTTRRVVGAACVAALALGLSACANPGFSSGGAPKPHLVPLSSPLLANRPDNLRWGSVFGRHNKVFGLSVPGAPQAIGPIQTVADNVDRMPNVIGYYQDWAQPFDSGRAENACAAGAVPMLTWESWNWQDVAHGAPAFSQPAYAPRKITAGKYDRYIRRSAAAMKSVRCPMIVRLDQEPNGYWYPWGMTTAGMRNTPQQYVAMWRHVWRIFHQMQVRNVYWCWSPNIITKQHPFAMRGLYPGNRFVDVVGLDGYLTAPDDTTQRVFGPLMRQLKRFASSRPWLIAETGVATGWHQADGIAELLRSVAASKRLDGLVYLDEPARRANWSIAQYSAAMHAFRTGINAPAYGRAHA